MLTNREPTRYRTDTYQYISIGIDQFQPTGINTISSLKSLISGLN